MPGGKAVGQQQMTDEERALLLICAEFVRESVSVRMNVVSVSDHLMGGDGIASDVAALAQERARLDRIDAAKRALDRIDALVDKVEALGSGR